MGTYLVTIVLKDNGNPSMQNQYNLNVKVIADKIYIHKPKESQDLVASITKISQTGEVTIQFN